MNFSNINDTSDIDTNYDKFVSDLTSLVSKHIPSRTTPRRELKFKLEPWINYRIQKMIKIRDQFLSKFNQDKSDKTLVAYKKFRSHTTNELKQARKKYFQNYFMENGTKIRGSYGLE